MTEKATDILFQKSKDEPFTQNLGIRVKSVEPGYAKVEMPFQESMRNLLGTMHGGAIFTLVDVAFELSCNSHGTIAVALNVNLSYFAAPEPGGTLTAEAREVSCTPRTGTYQILVTDDNGKKIALCQAVAYRKKHPLAFFDGTSL